MQAVTDYIAAWQAPDADRARACLARCWDADSQIVGPGYRFTGTAEVLAEIERFRHDQPGWRVVATSAPETHGAWARFGIAMVDPAGALVHCGQDIVELKPDGRIARVVTFWDAAPPAPRVGVGVLVLHEGLVLLGRRRGAHGAGTWSAPGGRLEYGEQILDCAARELMEETGLTARVLELGPYANDVFADVRQQYVTIFVVARGIQGTPVNREPDKCEGWAWFQWGEWPSPLFQPVQSFLAIGWRPGGT